MDSRSGNCYGLNRSGALILQRLVAGEPSSTIAESVAEMAKLDSDKASALVQDFLRHLATKGLLTSG